MTIIQSLLSPFIPFSPSTRSVVNATGGDEIVITGSVKVHIFRGPGTFTVNSAPPTTVITYFVVAGGGGGGSGGELSTAGPYITNAGFCGAGGGGGGVRRGTLPLTSFIPGVGAIPPAGPGPWVMPVIVGAGGAGGVDNVYYPGSPMISGYGFPGSPSVFWIWYPGLNSNVESTGGGGGASVYDPTIPPAGPPANVGVVFPGRPGGSGGGARTLIYGGNTSVPGGSGSPNPFLGAPYSVNGGLPTQGSSGGSIPTFVPGVSPYRTWGTGGGGAGGVGYYDAGGEGRSTDLVPMKYGTDGPYNVIPSSTPSRYFGGGGDGGTRPPYNAITLAEPSRTYSPAGGGGAKNPLNSPSSPAAPGIVNTGGGGAGASGTTQGVAGGAGGPGIVIVGYIYY